MTALAQYFSEGRVLLLGEEFARNSLLSATIVWELSSTVDRLKPDQSATYGQLTVVHRWSVHPVLENPVGLRDIDVALVALDPTESPEKCDDLAKGIAKLADCVRSMRQQARETIVSFALPNLVLITSKLGPVPQTIWRLQEEYSTLVRVVSASDRLDWLGEFRRVVVSSLSEAAVRMFGLPFPDGLEIFSRWLGQFKEEDRGSILRLSRYFRYYTAEEMLFLSGKYLEASGSSLLGVRREEAEPGRAATSLWLSYLGWPNKSAPAVLPIIAKTRWIRDLAMKPITKSYEQLVTDLVPAILSLEEREELNLLLVDDVIGTGGQHYSYLERFFNRDLRRAAYGFGGKRYGERIWERVVEAVSSGGGKQVIIHSLFLVGIQNSLLEALTASGLEPDYRIGSTLSESGVRSRQGNIAVDLKMGRRDDVTVDVLLHIIDYTLSINELIDLELIDEASLRRVLLRNDYSLIARPREKEHALQFEPFGWKESGGLVATYLNCPGNTLPIYWGDGNGWEPLMRRYFNSWSDGGRDFSSLKRELLADFGQEGDERSFDNLELGAKKIIAHILLSRSRVSLDRVGEDLGLSVETIEEWRREVEEKLKEDGEYREELARVYRKTS